MLILRKAPVETPGNSDHTEVLAASQPQAGRSIETVSAVLNQTSVARRRPQITHRFNHSASDSGKNNPRSRKTLGLFKLSIRSFVKLQMAEIQDV